MSAIEKCTKGQILSPEQNKILPVLDPEIFSIDLLTKNIRGKRLEAILSPVLDLILISLTRVMF